MIQIEVTRSRQNFPQLMDLLTILGFDTGEWCKMEEEFANFKEGDPITELSNKLFGTDNTTFYVVCDWTDKSISVNKFPMSEADLYSTDVDNVFIVLRVPRSRMEYKTLIEKFIESEDNIKAEAETYFRHPRLQQEFYRIDSNGEYEFRRFYAFEVLALNNCNPDNEWLPLTYELYERYSNMQDKKTQDYKPTSV